jgi:hypothetical protein
MKKKKENFCQELADKTERKRELLHAWRDKEKLGETQSVIECSPYFHPLLQHFLSLQRNQIFTRFNREEEEDNHLKRPPQTVEVAGGEDYAGDHHRAEDEDIRDLLEAKMK